MSDQGNTGGAPAPTSTPTAPQPSNDNGTPPAADAAPPEPRYKMKLPGGKEEEIPVSELIKRAEKGIGADHRFEQAAGMRKEVEAILRKLPEDTIGAMEQLIGDKSRAAKSVLAQMWKNPDLRAEMESYLVEQYQYEGLPEQERRKVDEDRELRRDAAELKRMKEAEKARQESAQTEHFKQQYSAHFTQALTEAGIDKSDEDEWGDAWDMMVDATMYAQKNKLPYDPRRFAALAKEKMDRIARNRLRKRAKDPAAVAEWLGDEGLAGLRKHEIERHQPKAPMPQRTRGNGKQASERGNPPKSVASVFRRIRGEG